MLSVLYVWCQLNKNVIVNFWFGTQFKAMYLPWVLFAFNLIISGGYVQNFFLNVWPFFLKQYSPCWIIFSFMSCILQWHLGACGNPYWPLVLLPYIPTPSGDGWPNFLVYSPVLVSTDYSNVFPILFYFTVPNNFFPPQVQILPQPTQHCPWIRRSSTKPQTS